MKKYVFLTFAISGIGGTQIYVRNKLLYLQEKGWTPLIITEESEGEICVAELLPYKDDIVPELIRSPMLLSRCERERVLDKMAAMIGEVNQDTVIESNYIMATVWGEMLARKLGVKHFIFLIQEDYSLSDKRFMKYFDFKYQRGELFGNTQVAISRLFEGYREIPKDSDAWLWAYCSNTVEDCDSVHDGCVVDADYHIGSIGRINKPFVIPMIRDVIDFALSKPDKTFQLVMFGGTPDPEERKSIFRLVDPIPNLCIYMTGPIFPVPKKLLDQMDVFISSAGAASTSANLGYVTIAIDANDFEPIGILGHTTTETVHRLPGQPHEKTGELLRQILIEKKYKHKPQDSVNDRKEFFAAFDKHMRFVEKLSNDKEYYAVEKTGPRIAGKILDYFRKHFRSGGKCSDGK